MSVELKIYAEDSAALLAKLAEVAKSMTTPTTANTKTLSVQELLELLNDQLPKGMTAVIQDETTESAPAPKKPKLKKGKQADVKTDEGDDPKKDDAEDGEDDGEAEDAPGNDDDGEAEDAPSDDDFDVALELLASAYGETGGKDPVMKLLKKYDVARFADIDRKHGADLLKAAKKIQADLD